MFSTRERGSALVMTMIMIMAVMGMIAGVCIIANAASYQRQEEVIYSEALEATEVGVGQALLESRGTSKVSGNEILGPIELRTDYTNSNYHIWTRSGTANSINYTIQVKSAYWARHPDHTGTPEGNTFLRYIPKLEREDPEQAVFDIYQITVASSEVGSNQYRRGVQTVMEMHKAKIGVPAALYIDNDPDPVWNGNRWFVRGGDHAMEPNANMETCATCDGFGWVTTTGPCAQCGGATTIEQDCGTCAGTGRDPAVCAPCGNDGIVSTNCGTCGGSGRDDPACTFCGGDGVKDNGDPCHKCNACGDCGGDGLVDAACASCVACGDCAGIGKVAVQCPTCVGVGTTTSTEDCPTCHGTGAVAGDDPAGNDSFHDSSYIVPEDQNPDHKPAIGYNGVYSDLGLTALEEDQITTIDTEGTTVNGEDAYIDSKIDLRELAAAFVGGPASDPLSPTRTDIQQISDINNGLGAGDDGLGDKSNFGVTYINGDAGTVAGQVEGAGVLVVDGNIKITGQMTWYGIVIVLGDMEMSGGGGGIHIFGSIMVESESVVSGNADIWWSSEAYRRVMEQCRPQLRVTPLFKGWRVLDKAEIQQLGF